MRTKLVILFIFATMVSYAQITTLGEPVKERPQIVYPQYDSLTNFEPCYPYPNENHKSSYKHLIGQKVYIVNNSDYDDQLRKVSWTSFNDEKNKNWGVEGHYMTIIALQLSYVIGCHYENYDNAFDIAFRDDRDSVLYFYKKEHCHNININKYLVVVGHLEKIKQLYEGKEFVFVEDDNSEELDCQNGIYYLSTHTRAHHIEKGTHFICTGVSIDKRRGNDVSSRKAFNQIRDRVIIQLHDEKLGNAGNYYCYATTFDMKNEFDKKAQARYKKYILGKFLSPDDYAKKQKNDAIAATKKKEEEKAKAEQAHAQAQERKEREQQRIQALVDKYGQSNVNLARQGKVKIGWNKELCKEAWGEPRSVNKTTTAYGVHEQWVYSTSRYLYFDDGVLTAIQE